jgi:hypothetical protein
LWSIVLLANDIAENPGPKTNDTISSGLTISDLNIRSIRNKLDSILYLLDHDILCFTEAHLDDAINDDVLALPGYDVIIRKDYIKVDRRQDLELSGLEWIWVKIRTKPQQTLLNISSRSSQFII